MHAWRRLQASRWGWQALVPVLLVLGSGCQNMSNTDKGILTGGGLGAATGALIGSMTHHAGAGAAIGAGVGAVAGGLTGAAIDDSEKKQAARQAAMRQPALRLDEVVALTQKGVSDAVIIDQIRLSGAVYHLRSEDITYLSDNGVREPVIRELQATAYRAPRRVVYAPGPAPVEEIVIVDRPPPPPVAVGVGFSYGRRW
jgi:hypothetical protein